MTGAMIPEGADAVVMQEDVTVNEDGFCDFFRITKSQSKYPSYW